MATLARQGKYKEPRLVKQIDSIDGTKKVFYEEPVYQVITKETANSVNEMLAGVIDRNTGWQQWLPGLSGAGKTGTAQNGKKYELPSGEQKEKTHGWFAGFAPRENPTIAVAVIVEESHEEQNSIHGGEDAAPIFRKIVKGILEVEGTYKGDDTD